MPISIKDYMNKRVSQEFFWNKKKEKLSIDESIRIIKQLIDAGDIEWDPKNKFSSYDFLGIEKAAHAWNPKLNFKVPADAAKFFKEIGSVYLGHNTVLNAAQINGQTIEHAQMNFEERKPDGSNVAIQGSIFKEGCVIIARPENIWLDIGGKVTHKPGSVFLQLYDRYEPMEEIEVIADSFAEWVSNEIQDNFSKKIKQLSEENHYSEEACAGCAANASANVSAGNLVTVDGNTKAEAITNSGSFPPKGEQPSDGFTYDEGKGRKDIVQLTGPLSEVYTRALNIYYAKKPAFDADSVPEGMSQTETEELLNASMIPKLQQASESVQLQDSQMQAVLTDVLGTKLDEKAKDRFDFVNDSILSDLKETDPKVTAYFMPFKSAMHPEVIDLVTTKASDRNKEIVMVITDETKALSKGQGVRRHWIDLNENSTVNPTFTSNDKSMALESVYINNGVKVVNGFSGFVQYLNALAQ